MKGLGTDEETITEVIANRSNEQRQEIRAYYKQAFGSDIIDDLKSELCDNYETVVVSLMKKPIELAVDILHGAMAGAGTDEDALIDVLTTHNNEQLSKIKEKFEKKYGSSLEDWIKGEASGDFERFLVSLNNGQRNEDSEVDSDLVQEDAERLYEAGEARWGTDESAFNFVLATRSHRHIRAVAAAYKEATESSLKSAFKKELSGNLKKAMLAVLQVSEDKYLHFAKKLHKTMKGAGTDDSRLIRTIVMRSEIDLEMIKQRYFLEKEMSLCDRISEDVSAYYKKILLKIVKD